MFSNDDILTVLGEPDALCGEFEQSEEEILNAHYDRLLEESAPLFAKSLLGTTEEPSWSPSHLADQRYQIKQEIKRLEAELKLLDEHIEDSIEKEEAILTSDGRIKYWYSKRETLEYPAEAKDFLMKNHPEAVAPFISLSTSKLDKAVKDGLLPKETVAYLKKDATIKETYALVETVMETVL